MRIRVLAALVLLVASPVAAQETYDLLGPPLPVGSVLQEHGLFLLGPGPMTLAMRDRSAQAQWGFQTSRLARMKVLRKSGDEIREFDEHVLHDLTTSVLEGLGDPQVASTHSAIEGRTAHLSNRSGSWTRTLVGRRADEAEQAALEDLSTPELDSLVYPTSRVPVGYSWSMSPQALGKFFGGSTKMKSGKATLSFVDIAVVNGDSCAVVAVSMQVEVEMSQGEEGSVSGSLALAGRVLRSLRDGTEPEVWIKGDANLGILWNTAEGPMRGIMTGPIMMTYGTRLTPDF